MDHRRQSQPERSGESAHSPGSLATALETWEVHHEGGARAGEPRPVPALTIIHHPDTARVGDTAVLHELTAGKHVLLSRATPDFGSSDRTAEPLADRNLSRSAIHLIGLPDGVRIDAADSRMRVAVRGETLNAPLDLSTEALERGVSLELARRLVLLLHLTKSGTTTGVIFSTAPGDPVGAELTGENWAMRRLRHDIRRVADTDVSVLIRGETGTGKELVARSIHRASARSAGRFVVVNLAAIPASLVAAELFGAERGAYTGSVGRQIGYFAQAQGGTLFLDEVGEAPPEVQVALLRVLESGEIQPVGSQSTRKVDVRIVAATDAALEAKIDQGQFRAPLLHRLAAYELWVPPLRDRRDDVGRLLLQFFREELAHFGEADRLDSAHRNAKPWLPASLVAELVDHDWPGNVRQLRNVVRQLVISSRGRDQVEIGPGVARQLQGSSARPPVTLAAPLAAPAASPPPPATPSPPLDRRKRAEVSEGELAEALRACRWDLAAAAQTLGVSRTSVYSMIQQSTGLRTAGDLSADEIVRANVECDGDVERMVERLEVSERALRRRLRELGLESRNPERTTPGDLKRPKAH